MAMLPNGALCNNGGGGHGGQATYSLDTVVSAVHRRPEELRAAGLYGTGRPVNNRPVMLDKASFDITVGFAGEDSTLRSSIFTLIAQVTRGGVDAHFVRPDGIVPFPKEMHEKIVGRSWSRLLRTIMWSALVRGLVVVRLGSKKHGGYARESRDKIYRKRMKAAESKARAEKRFGKRARAAARGNIRRERDQEKRRRSSQQRQQESGNLPPLSSSISSSQSSSADSTTSTGSEGRRGLGGGADGGSSSSSSSSSDFSRRAWVLSDAMYEIGRTIDRKGRMRYRAYHPIRGSNKEGNATSGDRVRMKNVKVYVLDEPSADMKIGGPTRTALPNVCRHEHLQSTFNYAEGRRAKGNYVYTRSAGAHGGAGSAGARANDQRVQDIVLAMDSGDSNNPIVTRRVGDLPKEHYMNVRKVLGGIADPDTEDPRYGEVEAAAIASVSQGQRSKSSSDARAAGFFAPPNHGIQALPSPSTYPGLKDTLSDLERLVINSYGLSQSHISAEGVRHAAGIEAMNHRLHLLVTNHREWIQEVLEDIVNIAYRPELQSVIAGGIGRVERSLREGRRARKRARKRSVTGSPPLRADDPHASDDEAHTAMGGAPSIFGGSGEHDKRASEEVTADTIYRMTIDDLRIYISSSIQGTPLVDMAKRVLDARLSGKSIADIMPPQTLEVAERGTRAFDNDVGSEPDDKRGKDGANTGGDGDGGWRERIPDVIAGDAELENIEQSFKTAMKRAVEKRNEDSVSRVPVMREEVRIQIEFNGKLPITLERAEALHRLSIVNFDTFKKLGAEAVDLDANYIDGTTTFMAENQSREAKKLESLGMMELAAAAAQEAANLSANPSASAGQAPVASAGTDSRVGAGQGASAAGKTGGSGGKRKADNDSTPAGGKKSQSSEKKEKPAASASTSTPAATGKKRKRESEAESKETPKKQKSQKGGPKERSAKRSKQ